MSWIPYSVAWLAGLLLTGVITGVVGSREVTTHRLQVQRRTDHLTTVLQRNLNRYTEVLLALGDLYRVNNATVAPDIFAAFVERALQTYPGIQALEWAPTVRDEEREAFEEQMRALGIPDFGIRERSATGSLREAGKRDHYVPVTYVQPLTGNEVAVGFDLASDPTRRLALQAAAQTGALVATARIRLVQETDEQFGFLVFLPLFHPVRASGPLGHGDPDFLVGVFRVADVVEEAFLALDSDLSFALYDVAGEGERDFLGFFDAQSQRLSLERPDPDAWQHRFICPQGCEQTLTIGGRQWLLTFAVPSPLWLLPMAVWATALMGLTLTGMGAEYLRRSQTELLRMRELSALKQRLFAMASHELRTPLSTLLLSAQTLEADPELESEARQKMVGRIRAAAKHMTQLLNDLLTLNRAEAGKLSFSPELVNLSALCQTWLASLQDSFMTPHPVIASLDPCCEKVFVDPKLLQPIIANVVGNGIKYSAPTVPVHFSLTCAADAIQIRVEDRGIGIPAEDLPYLYDTFFRGSNVGERPGSGLGLAIVKTCTELHQGHLSLSSVLGQGTTVTMTLPRID